MVGMVLSSFLCKQCGRPIQLPQHVLLKPFEYLDDPPKEISPVAIVCPYCKTVENYALEDLHGAGVALNPGHNWLSLEPWLECEEQPCEALLPLFVEWGVVTSEEERGADIKTWKWGQVHCPAGHTIARPDW